MQGPPPATHHQRPGGDTLSRIPQPAVHRERSVARGHNSAVITVLTHTHPDTESIQSRDWLSLRQFNPTSLTINEKITINKKK